MAARAAIVRTPRVSTLVRTARAAVIGCAVVAAGLMPAADASALDFRSAGDAPVVLYDAPSTKATLGSNAAHLTARADTG